MEQPKTLGLLAGGGRLPFLVADGARRAGLKVVCGSLGGSADADLAGRVDVFAEVPLARPGKWIRHLRKHGAARAIMVGRVAKQNIYTPRRIMHFIPDWRAFRIWYWRLRGQNKHDQTILQAIADELTSGGIILEDSTMYCKEHLASPGVMTKTSPGAGAMTDIEYGWEMIRRLGELHIGQAIAVKERSVIAVEAVEGTAMMINRAGECCKAGGWTLVKASRSDQDMRFDVPCVGEETIRSLAENGGRCLVVEAGRTIILDKPRTIALADKLGVVIYGCLAMDSK
ncbi:MAG TPA: UDP-2,3-diacylglucosamine diphosphatase LpxI [Sedimentisphaerales bacterium]|nr:UDP-2,3-diacylglucosamine diphosphatase LpxI [Sedimentisphaerales bacterium]